MSGRGGEAMGGDLGWGEDVFESECRCGALGNEDHATDCIGAIGEGPWQPFEDNPRLQAAWRGRRFYTVRVPAERRLHAPRRSTDKWPGFTSNTGSLLPGDRRKGGR